MRNQSYREWHELVVREPGLFFESVKPDSGNSTRTGTKLALLAQNWSSHEVIAGLE